MKIIRLVNEYCEWMTGIGGVSDSSVVTYKFKLNRALKTMCDGEEMRDVAENELSKYLNKLRMKQSVSSQRLMVTVLKGFFGWYHNKYNGNNPTTALKPIKEYKRHPEIIRLHDVERMIAEAGRDNFLQMRNAAIISILADTGIRVSELCELRLCNISMEDSQFLMAVPAIKTKQTRVIPFCYMSEGSLVAETFAYYYATVKYQRGWQPDDYLFQTAECHYLKVPGGWIEGRKRWNAGSKLNRNLVRDMLKRVADRAGVERRVTPHSFRHFYATYLAVNGADPLLIQKRLGHASMDKTMIYIHYADIVKGDSSKHNPLSKLTTPYKGAVKALKSIREMKHD